MAMLWIGVALMVFGVVSFGIGFIEDPTGAYREWWRMSMGTSFWSLTIGWIMLCVSLIVMGAPWLFLAAVIGYILLIAAAVATIMVGLNTLG